LLAQGAQILSRLHRTKYRLQESERNGFVHMFQQPEWIQVLIKIEKRFPKLTDLTKVPHTAYFII
jgi:hypothetical protein